MNSLTQDADRSAISVSVVICTLNRQAIVRDTARKLAGQDYKDCEFLIVDQTAERDLELEAIVSQLGSRFRYLRIPKPNLPAARNVGIRNTSGEIILFIDDDVDPDNDLVSLHVRVHQEQQNVGVVAGLLVNIDRPLEEALESCRRSFNVPEVKTGGLFDVSIAVGGNMSYLRPALVCAGFFDENFRGCGLCEDTDASERVALKGYRILLDCRIRLRHLNLTSGGCELRNEAQQHRLYVEQFELTMYRFIKRFMLKPKVESVLALLATIRQFMLNRPLLKQGFMAVIRRQFECMRSITRVMKWVYSWATQQPSS